MNLKLRFALLFTSFVAVILIISSFTIYFLYSNYRQEDFFRRVKRGGLAIYDLYREEGNKRDSLKMIKQVSRVVLLTQTEVVLDSTGRVIYKDPDTLTHFPNKVILDKIKASDEYTFQDDTMRQYMGIYMPDSQHYIWTSAYDRTGIKKMDNVKLILIGVLIGALLLTAFVSFFFVQSAFKPLRKLREQMQRTSDPNLAEKVIESRGNDEMKLIARSYNEMLERQKNVFNQQKSFVHHASHELRTPLASMLSQTESAFNRDLDVEGYKKTLLSLKEDQQEMIELTNSLLLLSQYEKLTFSEDWEILRIDEVLYDTIKATKKMLPQANISMEFLEIPKEENLLIKGNEALLRSAIRNLIRNAFQYSDNKSVTISLFADDDKVELIFDNSGTQLSKEEQKSLFIPFFRGDNAIKKKGHGLGLAIVQRITDVHKGHVSYAAIENNINRFVITLYKKHATKRFKVA
jgi:signal transduction histidine kinase